jgi:hypothetical protein
MNKPLKRREFLVKGACAGCILLLGSKASAFENLMKTRGDVVIDPKSLNYCGYQCPPDCPFLQGSLKNDVALKKEAYEKWKIKEKYGLDFDPDTIFCFGCKNKEKPEGVVLTHCTVRKCAIEKGHDCCIECGELTGCDKELWKQFPDFKKYVIDLQQKYRAQGLS